jgi:hypothetical protein
LKGERADAAGTSLPAGGVIRDDACRAGRNREGITMKSTYEGWLNFETWCVNDAVTGPENGRYWRGVARWHASEAKARHAAGRESRLVAIKDATLALARELSRHFYDDHPLPMGDVYFDLLSAALDSVDYVAIADRFLGEFFDESMLSPDGPPERKGSTGGLSLETHTILGWIRSHDQARARWHEAAHASLEEARSRPVPDGEVAAASAILAEVLRDELSGLVAGGEWGVRNQLFDCALSRVQWGRLARRLLREFALLGAGPAAPGGDE